MLARQTTINNACNILLFLAISSYSALRYHPTHSTLESLYIIMIIFKYVVYRKH